MVGDGKASMINIVHRRSMLHCFVLWMMTANGLQWWPTNEKRLIYIPRNLLLKPLKMHSRALFAIQSRDSGVKLLHEKWPADPLHHNYGVDFNPSQQTARLNMPLTLSATIPQPCSAICLHKVRPLVEHWQIIHACMPTSLSLTLHEPQFNNYCLHCGMNWVAQLEKSNK